jgi:hypothetical protein
MKRETLRLLQAMLLLLKVCFYLHSGIASSPCVVGRRYLIYVITLAANKGTNSTQFKKSCESNDCQGKHPVHNNLFNL